jgi:TonB family protein
MKYASRLVIAVGLAFSTTLLAQNSPSSGGGSGPIEANPKRTEPTPSKLPTTQGPIDILTDTRGVDLGSYITRVVHDIREHWYIVVPESARPPLTKKGTVLIAFRIMKDGKITDLHYVHGSGDVALDQAAHDGIMTSAPFPALPREFACEYVALQFHFYYNPTQDDIKQHPPDRQVFPCVTSSVHMIGEIGIKVFPSSAELATGAKQQFSAIVTGAENSAVGWSVRGPGCVASACGSVSADGLYTAPSVIPDPPKVTVTVTLTSGPSETDSASVTIVEPNSRH